MQTIPIFAYLVPILFMFGFGPVSALVATIIYRDPADGAHHHPGAERQWIPEILDFGRMAGTTQTPADVARAGALGQPQPHGGLSIR